MALRIWYPERMREVLSYFREVKYEFAQII